MSDQQISYDNESVIITQQAPIDSFRELCKYIVSFGHPRTSCVWSRTQIERIYERAEQFLEVTEGEIMTEQPAREPTPLQMAHGLYYEFAKLSLRIINNNPNLDIVSVLNIDELAFFMSMSNLITSDNERDKRISDLRERIMVIREREQTNKKEAQS